jgi:hypothetical protein
MSTAYRLTNAPRYAGMREWDCALCGHETLKRPVFLEGPEGLVSAGTGCASVALYGRKDARLERKVRADFDAAETLARWAEEATEERKVRYSAALAAFQAGEDGAPALVTARKTYHGGGSIQAHGPFPAWLARVAETGCLD